jgi:acyl-CoA reductase-like NAD-dependent aldehyde dehydrogenase
MGKQIKTIANLIFAAVALAMGVAVIVMSSITTDITTIDLIRMLGIAAVSLGILALNNTKN